MEQNSKVAKQELQEYYQEQARDYQSSLGQFEEDLEMIKTIRAKKAAIEKFLKAKYCQPCPPDKHDKSELEQEFRKINAGTARESDFLPSTSSYGDPFSMDPTEQWNATRLVQEVEKLGIGPANVVNSGHISVCPECNNRHVLKEVPRPQ